jgi:hypothetical protein
MVLVMDKSHRVKFTLSPETYEAIGALAAHYSLMEMFLAVAIWHFLKLPAYDGTLVTATLSLRQRFDLLIDLVKTRGLSAADIAELKDIETEFSRSGGVTVRRNQFIHAVWATSSDGKDALPLNFNRQGKPKMGTRAIADDIEGVTKDICIQAKRFHQVLERHGYVPTIGISFAAPQTPPD